MNDDKNLTYCKGQKKESSQEFWSIQCFATNNGVPYLQEIWVKTNQQPWNNKLK